MNYQQQVPPQQPGQYQAAPQEPGPFQAAPQAPPPQYQANYQTMPAGGQGGHTSIYIGDPGGFNGFDQKAIRNAFVAKVYSIVGMQLTFATLLIGLFVLHEPTKNYFNQHGEPYLYAATGVGLVVLIIITCIESARRSFPLNIGLLTILTISYAMISAIMSARLDTYTVMMAFGTTAFATIVIILLAKYSPFDLTTCGCGICILALVHVLATLLLMIILVSTGYSDILPTVLAGMGSFVVSIYMIFDLQLIMGGREQELSPEEYILAATLLYVDIMQLFQYMLILFGSRQ